MQILRLLQADKVHKLSNEVVNLLTTKMPNVENPSADEKEKEMTTQITTIWDAIHANLMHHFSTYSNPGKGVVYSSVIAHKLIVINKLLSRPKFDDDKRKLYAMINKATSLQTREPDSTGAKAIIQKRNDMINNFFTKGEEMLKTIAEREKEAKEFIQTSQRKELAQKYEKMRKEKEEKERAEAEERAKKLEAEAGEMGDKSSSELQLIAEKAAQDLIKIEENIAKKDNELKESEKMIGASKGAFDNADKANKEAQKRLDASVEKNSAAIEKQNKLKEEKEAVASKISEKQRELEEEMKKEPKDEATIARIQEEIKALQNREKEIDAEMVENEKVIKATEAEIKANQEAKDKTQKAFEAAEKKYLEDKEKHDKVEGEMRKLQGEARVAKITAENAKKAIKDLKPQGPKVPERGFLVSVQQRDIGEGGRDPPIIGFHQTGEELMKFKAGDINRWFQKKKDSAGKQVSKEKAEDDEAILRFKEAFQEYKERVDKSSGEGKEKLLKEARNITDKISIIQETTT